MSVITLQVPMQSQKTGHFAQYHAPQTVAIKEQILKELSTSASKVRVIHAFATVAMGMGVDIQAIWYIIYVGPPRIVRIYFQETGCAGHNEKQPFPTLHVHCILQQ